MRAVAGLLMLMAVLSSGGRTVLISSAQAAMPPVQTVFVILVENLSWYEVEGSPSAPYLNHTLLPASSYCRQYYNPPGMHPSLTDYLWLEAGTNFGVFDDEDPYWHHFSTTNHLVSQLNRAGISWKTYQEDISGTYVPLWGTNLYTPRHNPFVYFDDITGTNNPSDPYGMAHIRPYTEFERDLTNNTVARYNFITPNLCDDMHDPCPPGYDPLRQGDDWLASEVPKILNSAAYQNGGALFITWDEGDSDDGPIGMILLSPFARGGGYVSARPFTHSSLLRTVQEIFHVGPLLGDAANAEDLLDLFAGIRLSRPWPQPGGGVQLTVSGALGGDTVVTQFSNDLVHWSGLNTNVAVAGPTGTAFTVSDSTAVVSARFYRAVKP